MNDRYLFKAKRKNWKELPKEEWWVQGYLFDNGFVDDIRYFIGGLVIEEYKGTACDDWDITGTNFYEIDDTTICQCTGVLDKRKNLIWENDIIKTEVGKAIVNWNHCAWRIKWLQDTVWRRDLWYWVKSDDWSVEVIGNIFDNPELLEAE